MTSRFLLPSLTTLTFLATFYVGTLTKRHRIVIDNQEHAYTFRSDFLRYLGLGFKRVITDIIWIQTLLESDIAHYEKEDLKSWLYLRFLTIAELDPGFYENYRYGGQYLMIIKDDLRGADDLMRRGLEHYPNDYSLNWQMGYLHAIEMQDPKSAFPYFDRIKNDPRRPKIFDTFFAKIMVASLGQDDAYNLILETWKNLPKEDMSHQRLGGQLYALKAEKDLACLNSRQESCSSHDFFGDPYFNDGKIWKARKPLVRTRLRLRNKEEETEASSSI